MMSAFFQPSRAPGLLPLLSFFFCCDLFTCGSLGCWASCKVFSWIAKLHPRTKSANRARIDFQLLRADSRGVHRPTKPGYSTKWCDFAKIFGFFPSRTFIRPTFPENWRQQASTKIAREIQMRSVVAQHIKQHPYLFHVGAYGNLSSEAHTYI